jgi:hypothetical protein
MQAGLVLAVLFVVVGLLLHSTGPAQPERASAHLTATSIPPTVVIDSNVTLGTVTVNGHVLAGAPPLLVPRLFHAGTNIVTFAAPPFALHTCRIGWVATQVVGDPGCAIGTGRPYRIAGALVTPIFYVTVLLDSSDLPTDRAHSAYALVTQTIAAVQLHTEVPAGHYYATGLDTQGHVLARRATPAIAAEVRFVTADPRSNSACPERVLCAAPLDARLSLPPGQRIWSVLAGVTLYWRFTAPSALAGTVIEPPGWPLVTGVQLLLADDAGLGGDWRVIAPAYPATVQVVTRLQPVADQLTAGLCPLGSSLVGKLAQGQAGAWLFISSDQGVAGCAIQLRSGDPNATAATVQATFLWRFGVLLAVDRGAQTLAPWLPVAPPDEVATVGV